jgi:hypothetical protein
MLSRILTVPIPAIDGESPRPGVHLVHPTSNSTKRPTVSALSNSSRSRSTACRLSSLTIFFVSSVFFKDLVRALRRESPSVVFQSLHICVIASKCIFIMSSDYQGYHSLTLTEGPIFHLGGIIHVPQYPPSPSDWRRYKHTITNMYIEQDMTLNDVCEKMRVLHQFKAS